MQLTIESEAKIGDVKQGKNGYFYKLVKAQRGRKEWALLSWFRLQSKDMKNYLLGIGPKPENKLESWQVGIFARITSSSSPSEVKPYKIHHNRTLAKGRSK